MEEPSQDQTVSGPGAIGVQVRGDNVSVSVALGGAPLVLNRLHMQKAEPKSVIELLRVDVRATRLVGRDDDMEALKRWREESAAVSVRCIIGRAGVGKTRLAVEACEAAEAADWMAGFVTSDELKRFHQTQSLANWRPDQDTLIVLDYAAASLATLKEWLGLLAAHQAATAGPRLRLLLLERHADPEAGWWSELLRHRSLSRAGPFDLVGSQTPIQLMAPNELEDRRALLSEAMKLAAPLLAPPAADPMAPPPSGSNDWFDERLAASSIETGPLFLLMAGIHAVRHGAPAALALGPSDLATIIAEIEEERLTRFALARGFSDGGALIRHLAACVTLQGGSRLDALVPLVVEEMREMDLEADGGCEAVAEALCDCLPAMSGRLDAIRPDLIGEAFVIRTIEGGRFRRPGLACEIALRGYRRDPNGVVGTLVRCAQDHAGGRSNHAAIQWLDTIVGASVSYSDLAQITNLLPEHTLALREFAAAVTLRTIVVLRSTQNPSIQSRSALAGLLNNLSYRLGELGRRESALAAAQEGVDVFRALAAEEPRTFKPDLAKSLNNLTGSLDDLGMHEAALGAAQEAVAVQRELAIERPTIVDPSLAVSLNNLAATLSNMGQREDALDAALESADLYAKLATAQPDIFLADHAMSLNNLARFLGGLGRYEAALDAANEGTKIYRALTAERPDAFTTSLADSLNNLAHQLSSLGQREAAFRAAQEAVELTRALAIERPDAFNPDLARSLANFSIFLGDLNRHEEALGVVKEAVALHRRLASQQPTAFAPGLAASLTNLANNLSGLGQREAAFDAAQEAVAIRRVLTSERPNAFAPDLAVSLINLAAFESGLGRHEAALESAQEAVGLSRALAAEQPDACTPILASSLSTMASLLGALGQHEAALNAAEEAVAIRRQIAARRPEASIPELALSLCNLSIRLGNLGHGERALGAAQEAVTLYRELNASEQGVFTPYLAKSLCNLGNSLNRVGQRNAALRADQEAVDHFRGLATERPDVFAPDLAGTLTNLANRLLGQGQNQNALDAALEAADIFRALAAERPDVFAPDFARSLSVLSEMLEATGKVQVALEHDRDAVAVLAPYFRANPVALALPMAVYVRALLRRSQMAGIEPDTALLAPILAQLNALSDRSGDAPEE